MPAKLHDEVDGWKGGWRREEICLQFTYAIIKNRLLIIHGDKIPLF